MINSPPPPSAARSSENESVDTIVRSGPNGAIAVAGVATAIVVPAAATRDGSRNLRGARVARGVQTGAEFCTRAAGARGCDRRRTFPLYPRAIRHPSSGIRVARLRSSRPQSVRRPSRCGHRRRSIGDPSRRVAQRTRLRSSTNLPERQVEVRESTGGGRTDIMATYETSALGPRARLAVAPRWLLAAPPDRANR